MTQETKPAPVPHVHQAKINEWAADPSAAWQCKPYDSDSWRDLGSEEYPRWYERTQYRKKPRWFDMEQEWIAKGKPPIEGLDDFGRWVDLDTPSFRDNFEYRFKEVSRHAALKAEWEAKGWTARQDRDAAGS